MRLFFYGLKVEIYGLFIVLRRCRVGSLIMLLFRSEGMMEVLASSREFLVTLSREKEGLDLIFYIWTMLGMTGFLR